jgi:hypothetical protein
MGAALGLREKLGVADIALEALELGLAGIERALFVVVQVAFLGLGLGQDGFQHIHFRAALFFQCWKVHWAFSTSTGRLNLSMPPRCCLASSSAALRNT